MVILFKSNKALSVTSKSVIMQKENLADSLFFYLPATYEDITFSQPTVTLFYKDPGNNVYSETLTSTTSDKDGYLKYALPLTSSLTEKAGDIELWLEIVNTSSDSGVTESITSTIHTGKTTITVKEWDSYALAATVTSLEAKIDALTDMVKELSEAISPTISA